MLMCCVMFGVVVKEESGVLVMTGDGGEGDERVESYGVRGDE